MSEQPQEESAESARAPSMDEIWLRVSTSPARLRPREIEALSAAVSASTAAAAAGAAGATSEKGEDKGAAGLGAAAALAVLELAQAASDGDEAALAMALEALGLAGRAGMKSVDKERRAAAAQAARSPCEAAGGRTPLGLAAGAGHAGCVRLLMAAGVEDQPDALGVKAIHWAAAGGSAECCSALGKKGGKSKAGKAWGGASALMVAASRGHLEAARALTPFSSVLAQSGTELGGLSALMCAALASWPECVEALLEHGGESLAGRGPRRGQTSLHLAAEADAEACLRLLLPKSDPNGQDGRGDTPLMAASRSGAKKCANLLLPLSDWQRNNRQGRNALHVAAEAGDASTLRALATPENAKARGADGLDAMRLAAQAGRAECVRALLELKKPGERHEHHGAGRTALMLAAAEGRAECVRILIDARDEQNDVDERWIGETALTVAAENGSAECVAALLEVCDPKAGATYPGLNALMAAAEGGHVACVRLLAEHFDHAEKSNGSDGMTALMFAAKGGSAACLRLLLSKSTPRETDDEGLSALMHAAMNGQAECVEILAPLCDPTVTTPSSNGSLNALMMAALNGNAELARSLAPISEIDRAGEGLYEGETALNMAAGRGHEAFGLELLAQGADWRPIAADGRGALDWAAITGCWRLAEALRAKDPGAITLEKAFEWGLVAWRGGRNEEGASATLQWALAQPIAQKNGAEQEAETDRLAELMVRMARGGWAEGVAALLSRLEGRASPQALSEALAAAIDAGCDESATALAGRACPWSRTSRGQTAVAVAATASDEPLGLRLCKLFAERPDAMARGAEWLSALKDALDEGEVNRNDGALEVVAKMAYAAGDKAARGVILGRLMQESAWSLADQLGEAMGPRDAAESMAEALRAVMPKVAARLEAGVLAHEAEAAGMGAKSSEDPRPTAARAARRM
jgi:ankyrin repeat protein